MIWGTNSCVDLCLLTLLNTRAFHCFHNDQQTSMPKASNSFLPFPLNRFLAPSVEPLPGLKPPRLRDVYLHSCLQKISEPNIPSGYGAVFPPLESNYSKASSRPGARVELVYLKFKLYVGGQAK